MSNNFFVVRYKNFAKCLHKDEYFNSFIQHGCLFILYKDTKYHNPCDVLGSVKDEDMNELRHIQRNLRMWQKTLAYEVVNELN